MKNYCFLISLVVMNIFSEQPETIAHMEKQVAQERMFEMIREREQYIRNARYSCTFFLCAIIANIFISIGTKAQNDNVFLLATDGLWMANLGVATYNGIHAKILDQEIKKYKKLE